MLVGYARVSTDDQDTALQLDALRRAGVVRIFSEKCSSVGTRPALQKALAELKEGHTLVVWKLDRVARSLHDLLGILARLKARKIGLRSLTEPIDTSSPIGEFMVQVLGAVAQLERSMIRERTVAGQVAAIRRGKVFGRPRMLSDEQEEAVLFAWCCGIPQTHLARQHGVSLIVVRRVIAEARGKKNTGRYPVLSAYLLDQ